MKQVITFINKYKWLLVIIGALILLMIIFQPCNKPPKVEPVKIEKPNQELVSVISKMETTASDGKMYNTRFYNLDAIISVLRPLQYRQLIII